MLVPTADIVHQQIIGLFASILCLLSFLHLLIQPSALLLPLPQLPVRVVEILAVEDLGTGHAQRDVIVSDSGGSCLFQEIRVIQIEFATLLLALIAAAIVVEIRVHHALLLLQLLFLGGDQALLQLLLLLELLVTLQLRRSLLVFLEDLAIQHFDIELEYLCERLVSSRLVKITYPVETLLGIEDAPLALILVLLPLLQLHRFVEILLRAYSDFERHFGQYYMKYTAM